MAGITTLLDSDSDSVFDSVSETIPAGPARGDGRPELPPDLVVRFREVSARRADRTAVEAPEGKFSYAELDRLSNQLSHRLRSLGVERDSRVGVSLPRGAGELLALLATAKAGAAYMPLDPSHPADRLRGIVEDAPPQAMIITRDSPLGSIVGSSIGSSTGSSSMVPAGQVVLLDDIHQATAGYDTTAPAVSFDGQQLAYILFTSGSTGRPKGVEISRGAFANFLGSMAHTPGMTEDERLLAITTTSFDIAGLELFLPLWVGGTVLIADKETARDPRLLKRRLEADRVSVMQATPATWRLLLEAGWRPDRDLRMFCGGEAMSPDLGNRLLGSGGELWNLYGPTETTVWSSLERITPGFDRITIGRPIDRTQMYVLDQALQPLPPGQEGEIWIGGDGLARGYFGRPELTAERFVQNPRGAPGDRIYRTGDLGRQLADGRFECLGRLDHQIKIRGFRIELGEIETVLRKVDGVAEALVVADQQQDGEPRLLAYWTGSAGRDALIEEARRKLPAYMVPSAYIPIDVFPLNTNGKIDRKRLPHPGSVAVADGPPLKAPKNDSETRIAAIWRQALGLKDVSVDQDFFTLGGTSALAAQVVTRLEQEMKVEIPLQAFYEMPTVEGMATSLGRHFSPDDPIVVRLREGTQVGQPLWCIFGITLYQHLARALQSDQTVIAVHVPNRYVPGRDPQPTITQVARTYVEIIRRQQERGPYHLLGLCFGGIVAFEIARQLEAMGEKIALVTILDALLPTAGKIDHVARLREYVRQAVTHPRQLPERVLKRGRNLFARLPIVGKMRVPFGASASAQPVDLPFDGPEVDAAVYRYAMQPTRIAGSLLIVRATKEPQPSWLHIGPDHGWGPFGARVVVHDIPTLHYEVLFEPYVHSLAGAIAAQTSMAGREPSGS